MLTDIFSDILIIFNHSPKLNVLIVKANSLKLQVEGSRVYVICVRAFDMVDFHAYLTLDCQLAHDTFMTYFKYYDGFRFLSPIVMRSCKYKRLYIVEFPKIEFRKVHIYSFTVRRNQIFIFFN